MLSYGICLSLYDLTSLSMIISSCTVLRYFLNDICFATLFYQIMFDIQADSVNFFLVCCQSDIKHYVITSMFFALKFIS